MTANTTGSPATASPVAGLPATWLSRARELQAMLAELAGARQRETTAYAKAYLTATGNEQQRTQTARLATTELHHTAELAAARVAAYKLMLDNEAAPAGQARGGDISSALWGVMFTHRVTCPDAAGLMAELAALFDAYATGDSGRITSLRRGQLERANGKEAL